MGRRGSVFSLGTFFLTTGMAFLFHHIIFGSSSHLHDVDAAATLHESCDCERIRAQKKSS